MITGRWCQRDWAVVYGRGMWVSAERGLPSRNRARLPRLHLPDRPPRGRREGLVVPGPHRGRGADLPGRARLAGRRSSGAAALACLVFPPPNVAQETFQIQVPASETGSPGTNTVALCGNIAVQETWWDSAAVLSGARTLRGSMGSGGPIVVP
jgi:hypothetical protein